MFPYIYCFFTEWILFIGIVHFILIAFFVKFYSNLRNFEEFIYYRLLAVLALVLFALCSTEGNWVFNLQYLDGYPYFYPSPLFSTSVVSFSAKVFLLLMTAVCVLIHRPSLTIRGSAASIEYSIFILFITLASFLMMSAHDLAFAFIAMELQTLSLIALAFIGHSRKALAAEAVFRYFFNASFASVSFLFGSSILYCFFGSLQLDQLALLIKNASSFSTGFFYLFILALILLFFAFFFKLTLAPFHHWVGDLYQGTSGYVGSYFTLVTKLPMWILLTKFISVVFQSPPAGGFLFVIQIIAILSIYVGSVYAFTEFKFRRFLAFSSIAHMGQILLGLLLMSPDSVLICSFYLFLYLSANIFMWALILVHEERPNLDLSYWEFFRSIFGLMQLGDSKKTMIALLVFVSMAGIPPAFGFVAKLYLFLTLYLSNSFWLLVFMFFINLVSLAYYIRLLRLVFFQNSFDDLNLDNWKGANWNSSTLYALVLICIIHSFFGFWLLKLIFSVLVLLF